MAARPPAELVSLLREFARTGAARACEHPVGAYANCLALSGRCALFLRERGVACGLLHVAGSVDGFPEAAGRWPFCDPATMRHWTVRVEDWSIDWTARQFSAQADWPEVTPVAALPERWRLVEDWACPSCPQLVADPRHLELTPAGLEHEHRELARATGGRGPFRDPRHDDSAPLVVMCRCASAVAAAA